MTVSPTPKNLLPFTVVIGLLFFSTAGFSSDKTKQIIYQCPTPSALKVTKSTSDEGNWDVEGTLVNVQGGRDRHYLEMKGSTNEFPALRYLEGVGIRGDKGKNLSMDCVYKKHRGGYNEITLTYDKLNILVSEDCTLAGEPLDFVDTYVVATCLNHTAAKCQLVCPK